MKKNVILFLFIFVWGMCTGPWGYSQPPAVSPSAAALQKTMPPGEDIRDIRGPVHIPYPWLWMIYVGGGLAILGLLYGGYRLWKRRVPPKVKLPHEIALERLEDALAFIESDMPREFSIAVSNAVRFYIEDRFKVYAARRTTEEFLHDLTSHSFFGLEKYSNLLKDFLNHCDLAKFARWSLSRQQMQSMVESARRFVTETQAKPEEEKRPAHRPVKPSTLPIVPAAFSSKKERALKGD